ncbi:MAG: hypothetical protein ABSG64_04815 [Solirubrobacteraceae bacterium]
MKRAVRAAAQTGTTAATTAVRAAAQTDTTAATNAGGTAAQSNTAVATDHAAAAATTTRPVHSRHVAATTADAVGGPAALGPALTTTVPGSVAAILPDGYAAAPTGAPAAVQQAIWAGNRLIGLPYVFGGGHGSFISAGYDCSGTVSYSLHGGGLLSAPLDSSEFMGWGQPGQGQWMTIYANGGHAFLEIAGIRLDTSTAGDPSGLEGPRWRPLLADTSGFESRHPGGY